MADELYHYGRMGMKWGQHIYSVVSNERQLRRANSHLSKGDRGRLNEAYRKDNPHARNAVAEINDAFDEYLIRGQKKSYTSTSESAKAENKLINSRKELHSAYKLAAKFNDMSPEQMKKRYGFNYTELMRSENRTGNNNKVRNAFGQFLKENGTDIKSYEQKIKKASHDFKASSREYSKALLGEYGNLTLANGKKLGKRIPDELRRNANVYFTSVDLDYMPYNYKYALK